MSVLGPTMKLEVRDIVGPNLAMNPKRIGFLGFESVAASDLAEAADVFAAAVLYGGYGNRISCYHVCMIGFAFQCFRSKSGIAFSRKHAGSRVEVRHHRGSKRRWTPGIFS